VRILIRVTEHYARKESWKMSMADNIKNKIQKKKAEFSSEAELRDLINEAASKVNEAILFRECLPGKYLLIICQTSCVLSVFTKRLTASAKLWKAKAQVAPLPEISMKQDKVLDDVVKGW
jgi:hypothetical protein